MNEYHLLSVYPSAFKNVKLIHFFLCLAFLSGIDILTVTDSRHVSEVNEQCQSYKSSVQIMYLGCHFCPVLSLD